MKRNEMKSNSQRDKREVLIQLCEGLIFTLNEIHVTIDERNEAREVAVLPIHNLVQSHLLKAIFRRQAANPRLKNENILNYHTI